MRTKDKFGLISFLAILMIVMIHSNMGGRWSSFAVRAATHWAVPWFFFASGVFFRQSCDRYSVMELMKRKIQSLLLPLLIWMMIWIPIGGDPNLWYLKSLIMFTFSSLIVRAITKRVSAAIWLLFTCVVFSVFTVAKASWYYGTPTSPFYFLLGLVLSEEILRERKPCRFGIIVLSCLVATGVKAVWFIAPWHGILEMVVRNIGVVATVVAIWLVLDLLPRGFQLKSNLVKSVFFIYCFHGPLVRGAKQLWKHNAAEFGYDIGFYLISLFAFSFSLGIALCLRRCAPLIYKVISGGR